MGKQIKFTGIVSLSRQATTEDEARARRSIYNSFEALHGTLAYLNASLITQVDTVDADANVDDTEPGALERDKLDQIRAIVASNDGTWSSAQDSLDHIKNVLNR